MSYVEIRPQTLPFSHKELCDIVRPRHGIITSIGPQHLETFKTIENILHTKFELADALPEEGLLVLNGDNEFIRRHRIARGRITYGTDPGNDYSISGVSVSPAGASFTIRTPDAVEIPFTTKLIGEHNIVNLAGAIAMSLRLGVPAAELVAACRKIAPVPHRLQLRELGDIVLIDDAYNSNPEGCEEALKTLKLFEGCRILITPGMVELGTKQVECNFAFGVAASKVCDCVYLVGRRQTQPIHDGLASAGYPADRIHVTDDFNSALDRVRRMPCEKRKIVLIENDLPDNY